MIDSIRNSRGAGYQLRLVAATSLSNTAWPRGIEQTSRLLLLPFCYLPAVKVMRDRRPVQGSHLEHTTWYGWPSPRPAHNLNTSYISKVFDGTVGTSLIDCIRPDNGINRSFSCKPGRNRRTTPGTRLSIISVLSGGQTEDKVGSVAFSFFLSLCRSEEGWNPGSIQRRGRGGIRL